MDPEPITTNTKKLMIVDDDADMRTLLAEYFRRLGFEVTEKESGPAALQAASGNRFDCFIFDVAMPEMSGLELLKKMRERGVDTPTLFLTAHDLLDDKVAGFADSHWAPMIISRSHSVRVSWSIAWRLCCDGAWAAANKTAAKTDWKSETWSSIGAGMKYLERARKSI